MKERFKAIMDERAENPELFKLEAHKYFAEFIPIIVAGLAAESKVVVPKVEHVVKPATKKHK